MSASASKASTAWCMLLAMGTVLTACGDDGIVSPSRQLVVTAQVSRTAFRAGDTTTIRVTTTNATNRTIVATVQTCPPQFVVFKGETEVAPGGSVCATVAPAPETYQPGESKTRSYVWHGDNSALAVLLSPGNYTVRGRVLVEGSILSSDDIPVQILASTSLQLLP